MKTKSCYGLSSLLSLMSFFLFSCASVNKFSQDLYSSKDKERKNFVQTMDGTVYEVNEIVFRHPLFGKSTVEIKEGVKINTKEVQAYQNNSGYYRRVEGQFAPRIKKGLINMYLTTETYQEYNTSTMGNQSGGRWRTRIRYIYHLQKGDDNQVVRFSPQTLKDYIQDYAPAMEYYDEYEKKMRNIRMWSWINTTSVIGGALLAGAAGMDKEDNVTTAGYIGVGLFAGGLVSGIVNKIRRIKPYKNLELALDEYNRQALKTKKR